MSWFPKESTGRIFGRVLSLTRIQPKMDFLVQLQLLVFNLMVLGYLIWPEMYGSGVVIGGVFLGISGRLRRHVSIPKGQTPAKLK